MCVSSWNHGSDRNLSPEGTAGTPTHRNVIPWQVLHRRYANSSFAIFDFMLDSVWQKMDGKTSRENTPSPLASVAATGQAILYSLVSSAKANGAEPFAWLKDVFTRLPYHREGKAFAHVAAGEPVTSVELDYLLPDIWLKSNPTHKWTIDEIRRKEREAKDL